MKKPKVSIVNNKVVITKYDELGRESSTRRSDGYEEEITYYRNTCKPRRIITKYPNGIKETEYFANTQEA